ncbi:hypothetical protein [Sphingobacterium wenxiniae]|uniref:Quercetin 2,3-dioxygenase C-terminal cupin domain-containing protein n=1 Tax=Sphingobacterium wenxiniae TaxID=683125 RepID=A0A1I6S5M9_9SPHI|nr:hypothetical protein [Sphingobacterium wenxiniae]SFS72213.1 hypothetical protein SAMN05660206_104119 [Sphingobacterium wenxiniae]
MEDIRIYIAEQRGETDVADGWVKSILNYGTYAAPSRSPVGKLQHANEWTGHAGQVFSLPVPGRSISVFFPLDGTLIIQTEEQEQVVPIGTMIVLSTDTPTNIRVRKMDTDERWFIFQQFTFSVTELCYQGIRIYDLPIANTPIKNCLLPVLEEENPTFQIYMGAFVGKEEYILDTDTAFNYTFAMALDGNFEVEQRLLFQGDALSLPNFRKIGAECLSATGLLLVLHF